MGYETVESSVLKVFKVPIDGFVGLVDHYYLAEVAGLQNSLGWGALGVELQGTVRVTTQELQRVERFIQVAAYNLAVNNCEHFANYVLYGINLSSQQHTWWKCLGAELISLLQPVQSVGGNYNSFVGQQAAHVLNENLRQAKIEKANREGIEFWKSRGIDVK